MTAQEIQDNYTFKVIKKVITREFPWIKDIKVDQEGLSRFEYTIFFDLFIDPYELAKMKGWSVPRWIDSAVRDGEEYKSTLLSLFFNESNEDMRRLTNLITKTLETVKSSPAIPEDMRLNTTRALHVGHFNLDDNLTIPNDKQ